MTALARRLGNERYGSIDSIFNAGIRGLKTFPICYHS
jgi:hypothetical protein